MRRCSLLLVLLAVWLLAACGATSTRTVVQAVAPQSQPAAKAASKAQVPAATKAQVALPCPPPPGEGVLGACTPKPVQVYGTTVIPVDPPLPASIPDVSSYQGAVNWPAVKAWQVAHHFTPGGIFKMGEYVLDPYAYRNNSELRRLGMWRAGYWFLRNTGCGHEAAQIVAEARALGLRVVMLDDEVSEARGYDGCVTPVLKRAGLIVGEYASPGAYPGGARSSNPAWMASYGPSTPPAAPWGGPIKAYQCTDGVFGCVTYITGLGRVDVSVDYGITKLGVATIKPKTDPYAIYPTQRFTFPHGVQASERGTVRAWDRAKCKQPARRTVCKTSRAHLILLRGRIVFVEHHVPPSWRRHVSKPRTAGHLQARYAGINNRLSH